MDTTSLLVMLGLSLFFATRLFFFNGGNRIRRLDLLMIVVLFVIIGNITYNQIKVLNQTALTVEKDSSINLVSCDLKVLEVNNESILGIDSSGKYYIVQIKFGNESKPLPGYGLIFQGQLDEYLGIRYFTKVVSVTTSTQPDF